jgi:hypothetical protein
MVASTNDDADQCHAHDATPGDTLGWPVNERTDIILNMRYTLRSTLCWGSALRNMCLVALGRRVVRIQDNGD